MKFELEIKPTEDLEKLKLALKNLFPDAKLKITKKKITGKTDGAQFWDLVDAELIRSAVEKDFQKGYIEISKAKALEGKVNIDIGSSIGQITLSI